MAAAKRTILGVQIMNRTKNVIAVQKVLSEYGCNIKTRLGLHDVGDGVCASCGLLLLELYGDKVKCAELEKKLKAVPGVEVKKMVFG